jgi:SAM-dependent methyltransferase
MGFDSTLENIQAVLAAHPMVARSKVELCREPNGHPKIVASIVPTEKAYDVSQGLITEYTETWRRVHDAKYEPEPADPTWDTVNWIDSYRLQRISDEEMKEWANEAVVRIRRLRPHRILEIGCGTGLLLYRLAPHCEQYVGLDFSKRVVDRLNAALERRRPEMSHVTVFHREAQDLDQFFGQEFDLVILNSVIMFLPSVSYLETVLERALRTLAPNGFIFIGDVRDRASIKLFHLTIALANISENCTAAQLKAAAEKSLSTEKQLLVLPSFFTDFASRHAQASGVRIDLKHGVARNEMNRFRFDATISTGTQPGDEVAIDLIDGRAMDLGRIGELFMTDPTRRFKICMLQNARLEQEATLMALLQSGPAEKRYELASLSSTNGVDPSSIAGIADQMGFNCCLQPLENLDPTRFNAIAWPKNQPEPRIVWQFRANEARSDVRDELNGQFRMKLERELIKRLNLVLDSIIERTGPIEIKIVRTIGKTAGGSVPSSWGLGG